MMPIRNLPAITLPRLLASCPADNVALAVAFPVRQAHLPRSPNLGKWPSSRFFVIAITVFAFGLNRSKDSRCLAENLPPTLIVSANQTRRRSKEIRGRRHDHGAFWLAGAAWFTTQLKSIRRVMRPIYIEMGIIRSRLQPAMEEIASDSNVTGTNTRLQTLQPLPRRSTPPRAPMQRQPG